MAIDPFLSQSRNAQHLQVREAGSDQAEWGRSGQRMNGWLVYRKPPSPPDPSPDELASHCPHGEAAIPSVQGRGPWERGASLCGVEAQALRPDPSHPEAQSILVDTRSSKQEATPSHLQAAQGQSGLAALGSGLLGGSPALEVHRVRSRKMSSVGSLLQKELTGARTF